MINRDKLRGLRAEKGLSQKEIADLLGISSTSYNFKENGERQFTEKEVLKLFEIFKTKDI